LLERHGARQIAGSAQSVSIKSWPLSFDQQGLGQTYRGRGSV